MNIERPALIGRPPLDIGDGLGGCLEDLWEEGTCEAEGAGGVKKELGF